MGIYDILTPGWSTQLRTYSMCKPNKITKYPRGIAISILPYVIRGWWIPMKTVHIQQSFLAMYSTFRIGRGPVALHHIVSPRSAGHNRPILPPPIPLIPHYSEAVWRFTSLHVWMSPICNNAPNTLNKVKSEFIYIIRLLSANTYIGLLFILFLLSYL